MTISTAFSLISMKSAHFPLQMIHEILITKVPAIQSYHPYIRCSFQPGKQPRTCMVPLHARVHRQKSADRNTCCSLPREPNSWFSESFLHKEHEVAASGRARLSCMSIQDHLLLHQGHGLGHQQQLRFGSDGCLRSLKPLPPDAGLASVDGILRLISIKSSFMFIAFFALVSTKMA